MAYKMIELPGVHFEADMWDGVSFESLEMQEGQNGPVSLKITVSHYDRMLGGKQTDYFTIQFDGVLEYRFIGEYACYEDIETHFHDFAFGLIEVLDSAYIENMASKGSGRNFPVGQRFGKYDDDTNSGGISEADVRHFRFAQEEWGKLDVIAVSLRIEQPHSG